MIVVHKQEVEVAASVVVSREVAELAADPAFRAVVQEEFIALLCLVGPGRRVDSPRIDSQVAGSESRLARLERELADLRRVVRALASRVSADQRTMLPIDASSRRNTPTLRACGEDDFERLDLDRRRELGEQHHTARRLDPPGMELGGGSLEVDLNVIVASEDSLFAREWVDKVLAQAERSPAAATAIANERVGTLRAWAVCVVERRGVEAGTIVVDGSLGPVRLDVDELYSEGLIGADGYETLRAWISEALGVK